MKSFNEILYEMPQLIPPTNFDLHIKKNNERMGRDLLSRVHDEIISEDSGHILFVNGNKKKGIIALINKHDTQIEYYVKYEFSYTKQLPGITQVAIWRATAGKYVDGITKKIFFEYLLKKYQTIISDTQQTVNGRDFWIRQMTNATNKGLFVGLYYDGTKETVWYDSTKKKFKDWLDEYYGWDSSPEFGNLRYLISTRKSV